MADSYHIIDGQVVPFNGGRVCNNTDAWRDATPLELQLQEQLEEHEHTIAAQAAEIEALQAEIERLRREVREWMCDGCNTVYPGPPQPGIWCVQCPRCGGDTAPRGAIERRRLEREIERLRAEIERRGAGRVAEADITRHDLAFYQGALDAAFEECEQLERTLNLPPGVHTLIYTRLKQWESLLDKLGECLPDD